MVRNRRHIREGREGLLAGIGVPEEMPFVPDPFQLQAIEALSEGVDTLVIAPTGTGKTYIAVEGIARCVQQGQRAIYTAPLKALSNAKFGEFKRRFEPEFTVGLLTGDRKIEVDASIVVATTEIYRNELYRGAVNYGLVVLDEFHYLSDSQRGPVWEESVILSDRSSTLLMLSASISNTQDVAHWIEEVRQKPVRVIIRKDRPVPLRLGFLHPDIGVIPVEDKQGRMLDEVNHFYGTQGRGFYRGDGRQSRRRRWGRGG